MILISNRVDLFPGKYNGYVLNLMHLKGMDMFFIIVSYNFINFCLYNNFSNFFV